MIMANTYKAKITGMTCGSCERIIAKEVEKIEGVLVHSISAASGEMEYSAGGEHHAAVRKAVEEAGYKLENIEEISESATSGHSCSKSPGVHEVIDGLVHGHADMRAERELLIRAGVSLLAVLAILAFYVYIGVWQNIPSFGEKILPLLVLAGIGVVALVGTGYHFASYHKPISCSTGMMEGMTFGMMAGFMVGALLGATNGMFWGSVLGMIIGCAAGVWAGHSSGVMGIMEGIMAGVMSGTMGAMLSVMLLAEPLIPFLVLLFAFCVLILIALAYMQIKELGLLGEKTQTPSTLSMVTLSILFFGALTWIMVYGPKSGPIWGG